MQALGSSDLQETDKEEPGIDVGLWLWACWLSGSVHCKGIIVESRKPTVPLKSKLKKDPGIPRLPDLKERVRNHGKRHATSTNHSMDPDSTMASEPTLSTLALQAAEAASGLHPEDPSSSTSILGRTKEQMRKYYLRTLHKVVDQSDIIILVLDARDPEGCRSRLVEEEVRRRETEGKKLVFVLNKVDLIPKANAQAWLKYLRHTTPTLPFLSSSSAQHQRTNIASSTAPALLKLLKAYKPKAGSVTVGVVGYPNVGKSSLINSLKRSKTVKVCAVAAQPGHTKDLQSVSLERGMRIIDSPGVVFDEDDDTNNGKSQAKGSILLRNVVKVEDVEDPIAVVEEILYRTPHVTIEKIYNLPPFSSTLEFLTMLAMSSGRLLKGGTPDLNSAARVVLADWNHQKIPYHSMPPAVHPSLIPSTVPTASSSAPPVIAPGAENVGHAQILNSFSKPFELDGLFGAADAGAFGGGDVAMEADEDGDIFFDAMEGDAMDEDLGKNQMKMDEDMSPRSSRKRPRSHSPAPMPDTNNAPMIGTDAVEQSTPGARQPKRQRKTKDVPAYDAPPDEHVLKRMDRSNPLSRRNLKKEAKRARKAHRVRGDQAGGVMEVDEGLQFSFMA
ncbi:Guanine nucleotide-binding protein-like 3 [Hypsizygus marmoreus]|uniref:Guanine nucleotide-binding protein-like 3 n=1 Tax=Hypsizygus marmoreus TaxID=39966 RepID=A0A369JN42_HYPMA|nr:Guanine nucleotide-binding protein-like 3 [Hypsizygus marmoreus]